MPSVHPTPWCHSKYSDCRRVWRLPPKLRRRCLLLAPSSSKMPASAKHTPTQHQMLKGLAAGPTHTRSWLGVLLLSVPHPPPLSTAGAQLSSAAPLLQTGPPSTHTCCRAVQALPRGGRVQSRTTGQYSLVYTDVSSSANTASCHGFKDYRRVKSAECSSTNILANIDPCTPGGGVGWGEVRITSCARAVNR